MGYIRYKRKSEKEKRERERERERDIERVQERFHNEYLFTCFISFNRITLQKKKLKHHVKIETLI